MADPFNPEDVERYKALFMPKQRPKVFGTPEGLVSLEAERSGLASFLGVPDYDAQLDKSREDAKLQFYLQMAQRGFAAAGAAPRRNESPVSTLSRELFSPLAGDASKLAGQFTKEKRAIDTAKKAGDRQIRLAALQNVQRRQDQAYTDEAAATDKARQFLIKAATKGAKVSTAFTVKQKDGSFVRKPVIVKTDWKGNVTNTDAEGKVIPANSIGVYAKPTAGIKPSIQKATDIEVMVKGPDGPDGSPGKITYQPVNALITTTFKSDGSVGSTRMTEPTTGKVLVTSGPSANARMAPKAGSKTSLYYAPGKGTSIYPTDKFAEAFGLPKKLVGAKAVLQTFTPKPDLGRGLPEIQQIRVAGKTYSLRDHKNYNEETGNLDLDTKEGKVTIDASSLWRLEDPKAYVDVGDPLTVPSGSRLAQIKNIKGLSTITANEKLRFQSNAAGETRILYGNQVITLSPEESALFQVRGLSDAQKLEAGLTVQSTGTPTDAYVYLPDSNGLYKGDPVVAQRVIEQVYDSATKRLNPVPAFYLGGKKLTDYRPVDDRNEAFETVQPMVVTALNLEELRNSNPALKDIKVGAEILVQEAPGKAGTGARPLYRYIYQGKPVELDEKALTALNTGKPLELLDFTNITGKTQEIDLSAMGQGIRKIKSGSSVQLPRAVFASLKPETQDFFSSNNVRQARAVKEADIRALWKTVLKENPDSGAKDEPTTDEIGSLFARFRGSRSQSGLRAAIFNMQSYAGGVRTNPSDKTVVDSSDKEYSYAEAVENQLKEAKPRYEALYSKGRLATKWSSLSFIEKMAFSRIPRRGLDSQKAEKQFQGALKLLEDRQAKFNNVTSDDTTVFAAAVRSLILLKAVKKGGLLNQTGKLEGYFSELGAKTFADYPIISSTESSQLNQVLTDVNSNLKTIASSEGVDGKPSNFRLQLQQSVLPEFGKPETENFKNLDTIISKLQVAIRSRFGEAIATDTVIPQSFVRMAAEAGIEVDSNQDKYPWINPSVSLAEAIPVTRENTLKAIGLLPFDISRFQAMKVGTNLPKDTKGLTYRKVSDTEVQGVLKGKLVGDRFLFKNTLGNENQGRTAR